MLKKKLLRASVLRARISCLCCSSFITLFSHQQKSTSYSTVWCVYYYEPFGALLRLFIVFQFELCISRSNNNSRATNVSIGLRKHLSSALINSNEFKKTKKKLIFLVVSFSVPLILSAKFVHFRRNL